MFLLDSRDLENAVDPNPRGARGRPWTFRDSDPKAPYQSTQAQRTAHGAYLSFPIWSSSSSWRWQPAPHLESPHSLTPGLK